MPTRARRFRLAVDPARVAHVRDRLRGAHWPDVPDVEPGRDGLDPAILRAFVDHVVDPAYDWTAREAAINALPHHVATIEGEDLHFLLYPGSGADPRVLLLVHGWPGGALEFAEAAERLSRPEGFGGDPRDSWTVVVPTLPGYGLSAKPTRPIGPRTIARRLDRLMRDVVGAETFVAQGGDWGSVIASWLGHDSAACRAVHLNFTLGWAMGHQSPGTAEEMAAAERIGAFMRSDGAYIQLQGTKPLTLAYAMSDSPLGAAAWILEKFATWSDLDGADLWTRFDADRLRDIVMVYLLTDCFGTASWLYRGLSLPDEQVPACARVAKPTGIADYPREIGAWPRSMVERVYDVSYWSSPAHGGHFAAFERPALFADVIMAFGRVIG